MATNLYYHWWFARSGLQRDSPLLIALHVCSFSSSLSSFSIFVALVLLFHSSTHTHNSKHTHKDKIIKTKSKKQRDHKNLK
jgi:hypothetical protein